MQCQKKKKPKTKQGRHRDVSTPRLVISITLPTLTQLCFSSAGNSLRRSSLILLCFISLGHKKLFWRETTRGFQSTPWFLFSYLLGTHITQNSCFVPWEGDFQTCKATPGSLTLWLLMLFGKSCPSYPRALPSSQRVQHPKRHPSWAIYVEKPVVFDPQTLIISPKLIILRF